MSEAEPMEDAQDDKEAEAPNGDGISPPQSSSSSGATWPKGRVLAAVEALLFASPEVLTFRNLRKILPENDVPSDEIREALTGLEERYDRPDSGVSLQEVAGGWQFVTRETCHDVVQALGRTRTEEKITAAAIETLSIIAYKQPITRAEVDAIRGVGSGQMIRTLMDKKMVKVVGRVDLPGRPFQYGTTRNFLEHFGLRNLKDLPQGRDL